MGKKIVSIGIVVVLVLVGVGMYLTRPVAEPSAPVSEVALPLTAEQTGNSKVFVIGTETSTVQFELDELLRNKPVHVVGASNQIAGQIAVTVGAAPKVEVGDLAINARTLKTDNENRNGAIGRFILKSEDPGNEFITFKSVTAQKVPATITLGQPFDFEAVGSLTIAGVTKPVTFAVKGVAVTETGLTGTATATVKRSDFGLVIPSIPSVANVTDEVVLTAKIGAIAQ